MKKTIIPAGYRLTVITWENDADNYQTKVLEGLSLERTQFLVELISLFKSKNHRSESGLGNMYQPKKEECLAVITAVNKVAEKHPKEFICDGYSLEDCKKDMSDDMWELLCDLGIAGGDFYTRVLENFKVEYMPTQVELADVTDKFKKS